MASTQRMKWRRITVALVSVVLVVGLDAGVASAKPAHCDRTGVCTPPSGLRWTSPAAIFDGVPGQYASINPCPTTRPDGSPIQGTLEVQVTLLFSTGGGIGQLVATNPDGSWSATLTWNTSGTVDPNATLRASCQDVGVTGFIVGEYKDHSVTVNV
jgi:hypothetical protein